MFPSPRHSIIISFDSISPIYDLTSDDDDKEEGEIEDEDEDEEDGNEEEIRYKETHFLISVLILFFPLLCNRKILSIPPVEQNTTTTTITLVSQIPMIDIGEESSSVRTISQSISPQATTTTTTITTATPEPSFSTTKVDPKLFSIPTAQSSLVDVASSGLGSGDDYDCILVPSSSSISERQSQDHNNKQSPPPSPPYSLVDYLLEYSLAKQSSDLHDLISADDDYGYLEHVE